jgi:hypothetical protein
MWRRAEKVRVVSTTISFPAALRKALVHLSLRGLPEWVLAEGLEKFEVLEVGGGKSSQFSEEKGEIEALTAAVR